jgi:hypothetical protein
VTMRLEDFETYAVEGIDGGGLKKAGQVIFAPVADLPSGADKATHNLRQVSRFLALLNELVEEPVEPAKEEAQ